MTVGELCYLVMSRLDLTPKELAYEMGVHQASIYHIINNKKGSNNYRNKRALLSFLMEDALFKIEQRKNVDVREIMLLAQRIKADG